MSDLQNSVREPSQTGLPYVAVSFSATGGSQNPDPVNPTTK